MKKFLYKALFIGFLPTVVLCYLFSCLAFPRAYGLCIICHARDLTNFVADSLFSANFLSYGLFLTPLGVFVGSLLSSKNKKWERNGPLLDYFIYGFFCAISALVVGMCPVRITSLLAWFSTPALIAFIGFVLGVFVCLASKRC